MILLRTKVKNFNLLCHSIKKKTYVLVNLQSSDLNYCSNVQELSAEKQKEESERDTIKQERSASNMSSVRLSTLKCRI